MPEMLTGLVLILSETHTSLQRARIIPSERRPAVILGKEMLMVNLRL